MGRILTWIRVWVRIKMQSCIKYLRNSEHWFKIYQISRFFDKFYREMWIFSSLFLYKFLLCFAESWQGSPDWLPCTWPPIQGVKMLCGDSLTPQRFRYALIQLINYRSTINSSNQTVLLIKQKGTYSYSHTICYFLNFYMSVTT